MPHTPIKPPTKRVEEIENELTEEMYEFLDIRFEHKAKKNLVVNFFIKEMSKIKAVNEILQKKLDEISKEK